MRLSSSHIGMQSKWTITRRPNCSGMELRKVLRCPVSILRAMIDIYQGETSISVSLWRRWSNPEWSNDDAKVMSCIWIWSNYFDIILPLQVHSEMRLSSPVCYLNRNIPNAITLRGESCLKSIKHKGEENRNVHGDIILTVHGSPLQFIYPHSSGLTDYDEYETIVSPECTMSLSSN